MADYKYGEMDISEQTKTYDGFISFTKKFVVAMIILLVFLAVART